MTNYFLFCYECDPILLKGSDSWDELHDLICKHKDETGHTSVSLKDDNINQQANEVNRKEYGLSD